ncbi:hypothetical protein LINPERHAP2_LOCUS35165 [Linum perenne]
MVPPLLGTSLYFHHLLLLSLCFEFLIRNKVQPMFQLILRLFLFFTRRLLLNMKME